jgi:hypothetical protein
MVPRLEENGKLISDLLQDGRLPPSEGPWAPEQEINLFKYFCMVEGIPVSTAWVEIKHAETSKIGQENLTKLIDEEIDALDLVVDLVEKAKGISKLEHDQRIIIMTLILDLEIEFEPEYREPPPVSKDVRRKIVKLGPLKKYPYSLESLLAR